MHLKKLSCSGFKSFADLTEFHFERGFTGIVGPNGCGKSNVVDAFRWVLGERSAKGLRGKEMLDVIFKGTSSRPPLSRAEVSLTFDNSDGTLPIEHSEVEVTRRLYRSGESEYLLNRNKCRLKDILGLFHGTGVGTEGYSILEQGSVDAFLRASPQERRMIFEEAAGISKFRKDRVTTTRQLERVETNLARQGDILSEVERRIRSVKIQAGKAQRFIEDKQRMVRLRVVLGEADLGRYRGERELLSYRLVETDVRRRLLARLSEDSERQRVEVRSELDRASERLSEIREREMASRMALERAEQRQHHIEERRAEIDAVTERRAAQRDELEAAVREYEVRRQAQRGQLRRELEALRECRVELAELETSRSELQAEKKSLTDQIKTAKETVLQAVFRQTRLTNERATLESEDRGLVTRRERRQTELEQFERERASLDESLTQLTARQTECDQILTHARESAEILEAEIERRTSSLSENQRTVAKLREEVEAVRARLRVLHDLEKGQEGVGQGAQELLRIEHPIRGDLVGLLASGIEAEPEIAPLVDAVLGHDAETLVYWNDVPLSDRARVLRELLAGRGATVVGTHGRLERRSQRPSDGPRPTLPEGGEWLIDLVSCREVFAPVVRDLLGRVVIVATVKEALDALDRGFRYRYVTRRGELIEPWGAVTLPTSDGLGLVSRRAEIQHLEHRIEQEQRVLDRETEAGAALELNLEARRLEQRRVQEEIQRHQLERETLERRQREVTADLGRLRDRSEVIAHEVREIDTTRERVHHRLEEVAVEVDAAQEKQASLEGEVEAGEARIAEVEERLQSVVSEEAQARVAATQNEERIGAARRAERELAGEVEERRARMRFLDREEHADRERLAKFAHEEEELAESVEREREALVEHEGRVAEVTTENAALRDRFTELEKLMTEIRVEDESLRSQRESDLVRENEIRVRMDGIRESLREELEIEIHEVPIDEWRNDLVAELDPKVARASRDDEDSEHSDGSEAIVDRVGDADASEPSAASENEPSETESSTSEDDSESTTTVQTDSVQTVEATIDPVELTEEILRKLRAELDEVQKRLKKNANVNLEAMSELSELEERQHTLSVHLDDLTNSRDSLIEIMDELNEKCRSLFCETFQRAREYFQELFVKIFGGGRADLQLEEGIDELEAGVTVLATPPGKRINSLALMSGGEKALTAVAVLFALFKTRPSPFCLLDEVDAPLDEANNRRYVRILEEFAGMAQFIVITHSKVTMEQAECLYGVTMEEQGVSKKLSVRLEEVERFQEDPAGSPRRRANSEGAFSDIRHPLSPPSRLPSEAEDTSQAIAGSGVSE